MPTTLDARTSLARRRAEIEQALAPLRDTIRGLDVDLEDRAGNLENEGRDGDAARPRRIAANLYSLLAEIRAELAVAARHLGDD